jgi:hypothetical protein
MNASVLFLAAIQTARGGLSQPSHPAVRRCNIF